MKKSPFYKSLFFAIKGIWIMFSSERNFQIEFLGLGINVFLIFFFKLNSIDSSIILGVSFFVLVTEILNTAVEKIADYIQPNFDKKIGIIKDIAAGAVLVASFGSIIIGLIIYYPYFMNYFYH